MKKLSIIFSIGVMGILLSCSNKTNQISLDFGSAMYKEPFRGLLSSKPSWLIATLDYPPCSWLKPDTAIVSKSIIVEFNEDAVRSNSTASIYFADQNGAQFPQIQWYCNKQYIPNGKIILHAFKEPQQLDIQAKIHPSAGNKKFDGQICVFSNDLDEVNQMQLQEEGSSSIGDICFIHEYGWPIILWLLWLIMALIIIAIVLGVLYLIYQLFKAIGIGLTQLIGSIHLNLPYHRSTKPLPSKVNKNGKKNYSRKKRYWYIEYRCFVYQHSITIHKRSVNLFKLMVALEELKKRNYEDAESAFTQLPSNVQNELNQLWGKTNATDGDATRKTIYSIPEDTIFTVSTNKGEITMTYKEVIKEYVKDFRIFHLRINNKYHFDHGRLDLSDIAIAKVKIIYESTNCGRYGKNGIQPMSEPLFMADKKFVRKMRRMGYNDFWYFLDGKKKTLLGNEKFNRRTPLVIHEDPDCQMIYIVPKLLHEQINHYGGISMAGIVRNIIN